MMDLEEYLILRQLSGGTQVFGGTQGWLQCGLLLCLFGVLLLKSEKIQSDGMFRLAWVFLVLSFLVPALMQLGLGLANVLEIFTSSSSHSVFSLVTMLQVGCGPVLLGLSLLFAFLAIDPRRQAPRGEAPLRHPLE